MGADTSNGTKRTVKIVISDVCTLRPHNRNSTTASMSSWYCPTPIHISVPLVGDGVQRKGCVVGIVEAIIALAEQFG